MANYGLVINSKFKPFSYEEMLAPVQAATAAHQKLEDAYSDLTTKAKTLESMLNRDLDTNEYNQYKGYLDKIDKISEDLAKNGLNPSSRQSLRDLNSAYMSEIAPMQTAAQLRSEKAKLQLEMETKNPSLRYDRRADQIGLSEYMNNPNLGFKTVNLDDVTNRVFQEASTLSKEILEGDEETFKKVLGGDYYEYYKQRGLTREQVLATIMNKEGGSKVLSDIINRNIKRTGVEDWDNPDVYNQVVEAAKLGALGAIGTAETQLVNNISRQQALQQYYANERFYLQHPEYRDKDDPKYIAIDDPKNPNYKEPKDNDDTPETPTLSRDTIITHGDLTKAGYKIAYYYGTPGNGKKEDGDTLVPVNADIPGGNYYDFPLMEHGIFGGVFDRSNFTSEFNLNKTKVGKSEEYPLQYVDMNYNYETDEEANTVKEEIKTAAKALGLTTDEFLSRYVLTKMPKRSVVKSARTHEKSIDYDDRENYEYVIYSK